MLYDIFHLDPFQDIFKHENDFNEIQKLCYGEADLHAYILSKWKKVEKIDRPRWCNLNIFSFPLSLSFLLELALSLVYTNLFSFDYEERFVALITAKLNIYVFTFFQYFYLQEKHVRKEI